MSLCKSRFWDANILVSPVDLHPSLPSSFMQLVNPLFLVPLLLYYVLMIRGEVGSEAIFYFQLQSWLYVPLQPQLRPGHGGDASLRAGTSLAI